MSDTRRLTAAVGFGDRDRVSALAAACGHHIAQWADSLADGIGIAQTAGLPLVTDATGDAGVACVGYGVIRGVPVVAPEAGDVGKALPVLRAYDLLARYASTFPARQAARATRDNGAWPYAAAPYGYTVEGGRLRPDPATYPVVERIKRLRAEGASYSAIARTLNSEGVPAPASSRWYHASVGKVASRTEVG